MVSIVVVLVAAGLAATAPFPDDAGFFLRYAEHLAAGHGFRFNIGDTATCGVSSPTWTLALASLDVLGLELEFAARALGVACLLGATLLLGWTAHRLAGPPALLATAAFVAANSRITYWATAGMEPPLGWLCVAGGLLLVSHPAPRPVMIGLVAGFALVHKLDMVPFGLALLGAVAWRTRRVPTVAIVTALIVACSWYGFAWIYFGSPVPQSVLRKLDGSFGHVESGWFATVAFWQGSGRMLTIAAIAGTWLARRRCPVLLALGWCYVLSHALAYTLRPPAERWTWYAAQVQPVLCLFAGIGVAQLQALVPVRRRPAWLGFVVGGAILAAGLVQDRRALRGMQNWTRRTEPDRVAAGQWIDAHLPDDARVATNYGLISYYCKRFVYDTSGLTRRQEPGDLVARYRPAVIALCPFGSGIEPDKYPPRAGYRVAHTAAAGRRGTNGLDFYVVVMVRDDVELR
jgi:hypothetical protein